MKNKPAAKKKLSYKNKKLVKEWYPTKNGSLTPEDVTYGSGKKVWWKCFYGHEWQAYISNRNKGIGCPGCYRMLLKEGFYSSSRTAPLNFRR